MLRVSLGLLILAVLGALPLACSRAPGPPQPFTYARPPQTTAPPAGPVLFSDSFDGRTGLGPGLEVVENEWTVADGALHAIGDREPGLHPIRPECWSLESPVSDSQEVSATVTVRSRLSTEGWAVAGVALGTGPTRFWHVALAEAPPPDDRRYAELAEMWDDVWFAQTKEPTALPLLQFGQGAGQYGWEDGVPYVLHLKLAPDQVTGEVLGVSGELRFRLAYALPPGRDAVRDGRLGLVNHCFEVDFDDVTIRGERPASESGAAEAMGVPSG